MAPLLHRVGPETICIAGLAPVSPAAVLEPPRSPPQAIIAQPGGQDPIQRS